MINIRKQVKNMVSGGPVKRTFAGALVGASIGYLAKPEKLKKVLGHLAKKELKNKKTDFAKATKEKISPFKNTLWSK
ncbi:hypothetical protein [Metabacillus arenae]|uniref:YtxH domain-containing protein n=1 Tax=Metabacillus arenae TaxID=2771434 RepID=A0A926S000_9BACI|nr:hypothetical protein [Metabacillus arenae]MBD1383375.1 hypothetical protein [Metabacillus arenae]